MLSLNRFAQLVATAAVLSFAAPALAQSVTDYLGVPGPVSTGGETYLLGWSSQPSSNYVKQEYFPAGQSPERYDSMALVEFVSGDITPIDAARAQVDSLQKRKATDPLVNMDLMQNDNTGEALLDFIVSSKDAAGVYTVEWNAYRYARATRADGQSGVLLLGVSHHVTGNDEAKAFLSTLRDFKSAKIESLAKAPLPTLQ